ncbi:MAG: hypothetical protein ACRC8S_10930 [Fimbriiglobus sp.]
MPYETRCPECSSKLRLDEAPERGASVECAKCGTLFIPPKPKKPKDDDESPVEKPTKKKGDKPKSVKVNKDKNPNNKGKKRGVKKRRTNPAILLATIMVGFAVLTGIFFGIMFVMSRAGSAEEMLTYVPAEVNWVRGLNLGALTKYPGYKSEVEKFKTSNVQSAIDHLAKAAGREPEDFVDYMMIAKQRNDANTTGTMYVFHTTKKMKLETLTAGMAPGTETAVGGEKGYKFPASGAGILSNATVIIPTPSIIVVIPPGKLAQGFITASPTGKTNKDASFAGKLNATGKTVIRGSIWLLMRNTGFMKTYMEASMIVVKDDFKTLLDKGKSSEMFGLWTSPGGGGVRVGAAFHCSDKAGAAEVVKYMKNGPLGKGDESEPTNQMKQAGLQFVTDKRAFGEFMQSVEWKQSRECAYMIATVSGDNAKKFMDTFNSAAIGSDEGGFSGGGGGPGFAPPGGGPGGGPPGRGLPGGIATPGMGPM